MFKTAAFFILLSLACKVFAVDALKTAPALSLPLSLSKALKAEEKNPSDPDIKRQLAEIYWCLKRRGLAYEQWLWILQFAKDSPAFKSSQKNIELAQKEPQQLDKQFGCKN